jgi:hypothetical protein
MEKPSLLLESTAPSEMPPVRIREAQLRTLGRNPACGITATAISRAHCELIWHSDKGLFVKALKKPVFLYRGGEGSLSRVDPGSSAQASPPLVPQPRLAWHVTMRSRGRDIAVTYAVRSVRVW